jgi:hypothetical protein
MKHENSNASTATTSSAGTPPTPEINGNLNMPSANIISNNNNNNNNNSNFNNYQQQVHPLATQMPLNHLASPHTHPQQLHNHQHQHNHPQHQISQDISNIAQQPHQNIIPSAAVPQQTLWNHQQQQQAHLMSPHSHHQQHLNYGNEMIDQKNYTIQQAPTTPQQQQQPISNISNGEYVHYAVNEQYSNKFDVQQPQQINQQVSYDSWVNLF